MDNLTDRHSIMCPLYGNKKKNWTGDHPTQSANALVERTVAYGRVIDLLIYFSAKWTKLVSLYVSLWNCILVGRVKSHPFSC